MKNLLFASLVSMVLYGCLERDSSLIYDTVISNVSLIDEQGRLWEDQLYNVYIQNDTIAAIITYDNIRSPKVKKEIDGSNKYLLPGFWDNHVHFRGGINLVSQNEAFLEQYIKHGITTVRDAGGDLTPQVQQWNREIKDNERVGPMIYSSGPKLDGPNARWKGSISVDSQEDIEKALDSLQIINTDYVKLYDSTLSRKHYLQIITAAEERNMITSGHMPFTVELDEALTAGLDNIEHLYYVLKGCSSLEKEITQRIINGELGFWDSMTQLIATYDEDTAQATFRKLREQNTFVTPTLHIGNVLSYLDEVDHTQDPYLSHLSDAFLKTYEGRNKRALDASKKAKQNRKELQTFFIQLAGNLHKAQVNLLAGSDCGAYNSYTYPGPSLHKELEQMVTAGLSPQDALKTSFYNGPHFLKKEGYGIKKGAKADLVLLHANPLEDITNTSQIQLVIKNGVIYKL